MVVCFWANPFSALFNPLRVNAINYSQYLDKAEARNKLLCPMEQHPLKIVNNCYDTNIYSYLEARVFGGQSSNLYLSVVHFFNTSDETSVAA